MKATTIALLTFGVLATATPTLGIEKDIIKGIVDKVSGDDKGGQSSGSDDAHHTGSGSDDDSDDCSSTMEGSHSVTSVPVKAPASTPAAAISAPTSVHDDKSPGHTSLTSAYVAIPSSIAYAPSVSSASTLIVEKSSAKPALATPTGTYNNGTVVKPSNSPVVVNGAATFAKGLGAAAVVAGIVGAAFVL